MQWRERNEIVEKLHAEENRVMQSKGVEYSQGAEDANRNFKVVGDLLAGAPVDDLTTAGVYFLKHVLSVCDYIVHRHTPPSGEGIEGRIVDARNYLAIILSIIKEHEEKPELGYYPDFPEVVWMEAEDFVPVGGDDIEGYAKVRR